MSWSARRVGLKLEGAEVALTFSGLGSPTPCLQLGRIRQVVPAPGPMGPDSCVLSRGPKIDRDTIATSVRSGLRLGAATGLPADSQGFTARPPKPWWRRGFGTGKA